MQAVTSQAEKLQFPVQTEHPNHYKYLKEFRVDQCKLFLQRKCTNHRPFTCFHWHFMNQKRRRPVRKRNGTFNYSPEVYCTMYDETTGICPNGDACPFLHRISGDAERRYHLKYYKTVICMNGTNAKGYCVKNGVHCAFAHGEDDLRVSVSEVKEVEKVVVARSPKSGEKEQDHFDWENCMVSDDEKWKNTAYVFAYFKTEPCKVSRRLCPQGYTCPLFHNVRDRRRSLQSFKYKSTPCPNVKSNDEWGPPSNCENGDECMYTHTRTEQQFHSDIYKSSKCNDVQQMGYCPRNAFCAFAHVDEEMIVVRDIRVGLESGKQLSDILTESLNNTFFGYAENIFKCESEGISDSNNKELDSDLSSLNSSPLFTCKAPGTPINGVGLQSFTRSNQFSDIDLSRGKCVSGIPMPCSSVSSSSFMSSIVDDECSGISKSITKLNTVSDYGSIRGSNMEINNKMGASGCTKVDMESTLSCNMSVLPSANNFNFGTNCSNDFLGSMLGNLYSEDSLNQSYHSMQSSLIPDISPRESPMNNNLDSLSTSLYESISSRLSHQNDPAICDTNDAFQSNSLFSDNFQLSLSNMLNSSSDFEQLLNYNSYDSDDVNMLMKKLKEAQRMIQFWVNEATALRQKNQVTETQQDEVSVHVLKLLKEIDMYKESPYFNLLRGKDQLKYLTSIELKLLYMHLKTDMDEIEKLLEIQCSQTCSICNNHSINSSLSCEHVGLCDSCSLNVYCRTCPRIDTSGFTVDNNSL